MTQREPLRSSNDSFHVDLGFTTAAVHLLYIRCHCFLGAVTLCLTNPIWVTKTRLVLQYSADPSKKQYKGMMDALVKIYRHEGIAGLYRVQESFYGSIRVVLCSRWVDRFLLTGNIWWNSLCATRRSTCIRKYGACMGIFVIVCQLHAVGFVCLLHLAELTVMIPRGLSRDCLEPPMVHCSSWHMKSWREIITNTERCIQMLNWLVWARHTLMVYKMNWMFGFLH